MCRVRVLFDTKTRALIQKAVGVLRENGFELSEGKYYGCAKLLRVNTDTGAIEELLAVNEGNQNFPDVHPNLEFTNGADSRIPADQLDAVYTILPEPSLLKRVPLITNCKNPLQTQIKRISADVHNHP